MKKLYDSELSKTLQQKLKNFEASVPDESEELIFGAIKSNSSAVRFKKIIPGLILLAVIPAWYFFQGDQNETVQASKTNRSDNGKVEKADVKYLSKKKSVADKKGAQINNTLMAENLPKAQPEPERKFVLTKENQNPENEKIVFANQPVKDISFNSPEIDKVNIESKQDFNENSVYKQLPAILPEAEKDSVIKKELAENKTIKERPKLDSSVVGESKRLRKTWLVFSIQPFLNYKIISPAQDGNYLSHFGYPSSTSANRIGYQLSSSMEFETSPRKIIRVGMSWVNYTSSLSYRAAETGNGIQTFNQINDNLNGLGLSIATKYKLKSKGESSHYLLLGITGYHFNSMSSTRNTLMLNAGYSKHWVVRKHELRATPTVSYGLTEIHYPGVLVRPYWVGLEMSYGIRVK